MKVLKIKKEQITTLKRVNRGFEKAKEMIEKAGLPSPGRPKEEHCPELPADITSLSDQEIGYYIGVFSSWIAYADYSASIADMRYTAYRNALDLVSAKVQLEKSGTVQERADQKVLDDRYQEALQESEQAEATCEITKSLLRGYIRQYEALSRELTRRQSEIGRNRY